MTQLRGSQNYIWSLNDVMGQGATGAVYKARHKQTGELYAVKTFNQMSHMRPLKVQMREFDVLQRLDHDNIVKLLQIEEETTSRDKVLVMELCTGGSLYHILDNPENGFGLEEAEVLAVLRDVSAALQHLRDNDIVHRDIKPGNIMKYISDSGRSIYKLIDFGAARQLQEEEQFMSLYGTEEYLHPDMYERAVLRRPMGKQFGANVDLWSLGVSFYHVTTGHLPFRPYGGRRNKETMYKITTEKASGVISGVQETPDGLINWSTQLPDTCQLSQGAKDMLTPLLAGLLENDPSRMWSFEQFFQMVRQILAKKVIFVFDLCHCESLTIYIDENENYAKLQDLVAAQTDIHANNQLFLFENIPFTHMVEPLQMVDTYPRTSPANPLFLYYNESAHLPEMALPSLPPFPPLPSTLNLDSDPTVARTCCSILCLIKRLVALNIQKQHLVGRAAKMYHLVLGKEVEHVRGFVLQFCTLVRESGKRVQSLVSTQTLQSQLVQVTMATAATANEQKSQSGASVASELQDMTSDLAKLSAEQERAFGEIQRGAEEMERYIVDYHQKLVQNKELAGRWRVHQGCQEDDGCVAKVDILLQAGKQTLLDFRRDKNLKKLSYNEEQIHKFDKNKLNLNCSKARAQFFDHCYPNLKRIFKKFIDWHSWANRARDKLHLLEGQVGNLKERQEKLSRQLDRSNAHHSQRLRLLLQQLNVPPGGPIASQPLAQTNVLPASQDSLSSGEWEADKDKASEGSRKRKSNRAALKRLNQMIMDLSVESASVRVLTQETFQQLKGLEPSVELSNAR